MPTNSRNILENLLNQMIKQPERRAELAQKIDAQFGQKKTVLVLDMSGFCRTARQHNIVMVLFMIHQMQTLLKPCIESSNGTLIKAEADNLFCLFDTVCDALEACRRIRKALDTAELSLPENCCLDVSIGIGYGRILNVENKDIFGDEVNLASKLGEDIAVSGEVLLTNNAFAALREKEICVREETIEISGFNLSYHVVNTPKL